MTDLRIDVEYAFFCDDVRREDNGKFIFVGVYTQQLSIATFPQLLNLSFFTFMVRIWASGNNHFRFEYYLCRTSFRFLEWAPQL
jgi:hypothetical protein